MSGELAHLSKFTDINTELEHGFPNSMSFKHGTLLCLSPITLT